MKAYISNLFAYLRKLTSTEGTDACHRFIFFYGMCISIIASVGSVLWSVAYAAYKSGDSFSIPDVPMGFTGFFTALWAALAAIKLGSHKLENSDKQGPS